MTARPALRRLFKPLLGAFLTLTGVLAPIESPDLPEPLDGVYGTARAQAQNPTVITGTPDGCPKDSTDTRNWQIASDRSLCELRDIACPEHPLQTGTYLTRSIDFPDFCEAPVLEADPLYASCTTLTGSAIKISGTSPQPGVPDHPTGAMCRAVASDRIQYLSQSRTAYMVVPVGHLPAQPVQHLLPAAPRLHGAEPRLWYRRPGLPHFDVRGIRRRRLRQDSSDSGL